MRQSADDLLSRFFSLDSIRMAYRENIASTAAVGMDGLSPHQFDGTAKSQFKIIHRKCLDGTYKFTPYKSVLVNRGPSRHPRQLAIPTVRDRIVLFLLKEILQEKFPASVNRRLPNTYISDLKTALHELPSELLCIRADIADFYSSLNRDLLFGFLQERAANSKILTLISRALLNPVVPDTYDRNNRHKYETERGVPQGLAISNILAEIYARKIDYVLEGEALFYRRYVDDLLVLVRPDKKGRIEGRLAAAVAQLDLAENQSKRRVCHAQDEFTYLGYLVKGGRATVKESTLQSHIDTVAEVITRYRRGGYERWLSDETAARRVFLEDLNEKITGAISENRRYGWIFYFLEIDDMEVLHRLDAITREMLDRFDRLPEGFREELKRHVRAYYEANYTPAGGYIRNYDTFDLRDMEEFLRKRDLLGPSWGPEKIKIVFDREKHRHLAQLRQDVARMS